MRFPWGGVQSFLLSEHRQFAGAGGSDRAGLVPRRMQSASERGGVCTSVFPYFRDTYRSVCRDPALRVRCSWELFLERSGVEDGAPPSRRAPSPAASACAEGAVKGDGVEGPVPLTPSHSPASPPITTPDPPWLSGPVTCSCDDPIAVPQSSGSGRGRGFSGPAGFHYVVPQEPLSLSRLPCSLPYCTPISNSLAAAAHPAFLRSAVRPRAALVLWMVLGSGWARPSCAAGTRAPVKMIHFAL